MIRSIIKVEIHLISHFDRGIIVSDTKIICHRFRNDNCHLEFYEKSSFLSSDFDRPIF